jgi:hypothetical protein
MNPFQFLSDAAQAAADCCSVNQNARRISWQNWQASGRYESKN